MHLALILWTLTLSLLILYLDNAGSQQAGSNTDWAEDELVVDDFPERQLKMRVVTLHKRGT